MERIRVLEKQNLDLKIEYEKEKGETVRNVAEIEKLEQERKQIVLKYKKV